MPRLKVMTLNLWGLRGDWPTRRDRLLRALEDEEIDVLLLQEVADRAWRPNQALEIAAMTGYTPSYAASQKFFPWPTVATGLAILSRFPIGNALAAEIFPPEGMFPSGDRERRIAHRVEVNLNNLSVVIYNTHFPITLPNCREASLRLWTQVAQEEAVLVVVGGDFNQPPETEPIAFLQGKVSLDSARGKLADSWSTAGVGSPYTFPSAGAKERIDYIFYQAEPSVIVQESKVIGYAPQEMSDHAAVVTTFSISPSRERPLTGEEEPVGALEPTGGGLFGFG